MPFLIFGHIYPDECILVIKEELGKGPCKLRLSYTCRAEEYKGTNRPVRILYACPRPPDRIGNSPDSLVLTHNPLG